MPNRLRSPRRRFIVTALAVGSVLPGCAGDESVTPTTAATAEERNRSDDGAIQATDGDGTVLSRFAGTRWFTGPVPQARPVDAGRPEVSLGFLGEPGSGIDSGLHTARAAATFMNRELGGLGGQPARVVPCRPESAAPEALVACVNRLAADGVVAVLASATALPPEAVSALDAAGLPLAGGWAIGDPVTTGGPARLFDGGMPATLRAGLFDTAVRGGGSVTVLADDRPWFAEAAIAAVQPELERLDGVTTTVRPLPHDGDATAITAAVSAALDEQPRTLVVAVDPRHCTGVLDALDRTGGPTIVLPGWCANGRVLVEVSESARKRLRFAVPQRLDQRADDRADTEIGNYVLDTYDGGPVDTPATIHLRSVLNLWRAVGDRPPTTAMIRTALATFTGPSFDGHDADCAAPRLAAHPTLCAPEVVLARYEEDGLHEASGGWVEPPAPSGPTGASGAIGG